MSRLSSNILWNLGGQVVLLALGLLAVRFVFRQLGADAFGLILFAQTASFVLMGIFDLGISSTIVREVAAHFDSDRAYVAELLRTGTSFYWGAYLLLGATVVLAAPALVSHWVNLRTIDAASATQLVRVLFLGALLTLPRSLYGSLFRGRQAMGVNNVIESVALAIQQLGIIVILVLGGGVFSVAAWFSASYLLSVLAYVVVAARVVPASALVPGYSATAVRRNLTFSLHMMATSSLGMLFGQIDKVLVSKLMPIGTLGTYGFAATLVAGVARVTSSIVLAAFPSFSDLFHRLDHAALVAQYRKVHALVTFGTAPLFAALTFGGLPMLTYVFNGSTARMLMAPLVVLCIGSYLNATLSAPYILSLAVGRPQIAARQNFLALFVVMPLAVALTLWLGLVGAAGSWLVYQLFAYTYSPPRICRECLHVPVRTWYGHIVKQLALIAATYGISFAVVQNASTSVLAVAYVAASIVYVAAGLKLFGAELRPMMGESASVRTGRAKAA
jgi:O-antigen/teichoic acid export membrane protein